MMPSLKQGKSNNAPLSPSKNLCDAFSKLIKDKSASLEACIVSVEGQIKKYHEQFIDMIQYIEQEANSALNLATCNTKVIAENTEKILSHQFDYQSLVRCKKMLLAHAKSCHLGYKQHIHVKKLSGIVFYPATGLVSPYVTGKFPAP